MKLYLMRHGIANDTSTDPQQGLSDTGRIEVEKLAERLATKQIHFSHVFHSPKTRAQQTAMIMQAKLCPDSTLNIHDHIRPNDTVDSLLDDIGNWSSDTLIVSHLPFLPTLLGKLAGASTIDIAFKPATLVCLAGSMEAGWQLEWVESAR